MGSKHIPIEEIDFFKSFEDVSEWVWRVVIALPSFEKNTLGRQLTNAIDSVGANLVEGDGRYSDKDSVHFFIMARASAREAKLWLERATKRNLVAAEEANLRVQQIMEATKQLNGLIKYRRNRGSSSAVNESIVPWPTDHNE